MSHDLFHHPEGDYNPYEPVGWARTPLHPTSETPITVGVRCPDAVEAVTVEWLSSDSQGATPLSREDGIWTGSFGPVSTDVRYRFVSDDEITDWFEAKVVSWERHLFDSVRVVGTGLEATAGPASLTLQPDRTRLAWILQTGSSAESDERVAAAGDWRADLVDGEVRITSRLGSIIVAGVSVANHGDGTTAQVRLEWRLADEERLFGTGERYDSLDQRGHAPDIRVYEQYKSQGDRTYFPLPWVLSDAGYGLQVDSDLRVGFDLGKTRHDHATVTVPGAVASGVWYFGTPKEVVAAYTESVGRPSPLPLWVYGPWMSSNEWDRDTTVREMVDQTIVEEIPATVLVIEAWSDEATFYLFNDSEYEPVPGDIPVPARGMRHGGRWPDPKGLIDWLHAKGLKVILWQIPVLKDSQGNRQHDADVAHAAASGYSVSTSDGDDYRNRGWWFPNSRIIDFTHPEAAEWWFAKRAYLVDDYGVDGFKTDGGEHLWGSDVVNHVGERGDAAANNYPTQYLAAYHRFLANHGEQAPVTFSRAGFTGSQAYPAHWAGDENSTWEAYRSSLTAGLSAALGGVAFWGWDIAGFSGPLPSAELYMRSTAMAAFCPIMQYHSEHNEHRRPLIDRTPWNVAEQTGDPEVMVVYRFYASLRMNLVPYLGQLGREAAETGVPLMRPLVLEYPEDRVAASLDDQFLLGPDLLVAPVLEPGKESRDVYIPDGAWYDLWTGELREAGWHTTRTPVNHIPVYVRGGAPIPLWLGDEPRLGSKVGLPGSDTGRLVLMVFPGTGDRRLRDPSSEQTFTISIRTEDDRLVLESDHAGGVDIWIRGGPSSDISGTTRLRPTETLIVELP